MKTFNRRSFFALLAGAAAAATSLPKVLRAAKAPPTLTITDIDFENKTITFAPLKAHTHPAVPRNEIYFLALSDGIRLRPGERDVRLVNIAPPEHWASEKL